MANIKNKKTVSGDKKAVSSNDSKFKDLEPIRLFCDLPKENLTLPTILHKISENLEMYLKIIEQVLQPEEFHSLHECTVFSDSEKSDLLELYKRIMIAHRESLRSEILNDEKDYVTTIKFVYAEILAIKPLMVGVVVKLQQSWKDDGLKIKHKDSARYFG